MQRLGDMVHHLARYRHQWERMMKAAGAAQPTFEPPPTVPRRLVEVMGVSPNPGNLRMFAYVPQNLAPSPALVVVLHGCTQTAAGYDHGTGWSLLAERYGFALLFPEQQEANNPKRCFNWFQLGDIQRDRGEALSIRQMVERMALDHGIDRQRVFVTGLSAGGAMTSTMLAAYPEVFSAGAIIAGLPYRCATSVAEAFECMFQGQTRSAREWGDLVRHASSHKGSWPRVSIWHGSADQTVKPMNAGEIIKQWTDVHGLPPIPSREEVVDGYPRRVWTDGAGRDVIEEYTITGMAHGTPLSVGESENSYGTAGPFLLDVGISSSYHIAQFWGLTGKGSEPLRMEQPQPATATATATANRSRSENSCAGKTCAGKRRETTGESPRGKKAHRCRLRHHEGPESGRPHSVRRPMTRAEGGLRAVSPLESALFFARPHFLTANRIHFAEKYSRRVGRPSAPNPSAHGDLLTCGRGAWS